MVPITQVLLDLGHYSTMTCTFGFIHMNSQSGLQIVVRVIMMLNTDTGMILSMGRNCVVIFLGNL